MAWLFVELEELDTAEKSYSAERYINDMRDGWMSEYRVVPGSMTNSDDSKFGSSAAIFVKTRAVFLQGSKVGVDSEWRSFSEVVGLLPALKKEGPKEDAPRRVVRLDPATAAAEPWVLDFLGRRPPPAGGDMRRPPEVVVQDEPTPVEAEEEEVEEEEKEGEELHSAEDVFQELEAMRVQMGARSLPRVSPFAWTLLGGQWTLTHKSTMCDAFQARATTARSKAFAKEFGLNTTIRFAVGTYGTDACVTMCDYWVKKMTFLYDMWETGNDAFVFARADLERFEEPREFTELIGGAVGALGRRLAALRGLAPSRIA